MARLNITVPDELYERLERHRESLNLSRICSAGLQQAVAGLEGQAGRAGPPDAVVTSLVLRLQRTHERWYERGWHDGRAWAAERASPQELRAVATVMAEWTGEQLLAAWEEWQAYSVVLDAPVTSELIWFGLLLHGVGAVWIDDIRFDVVGPEVPVTSQAAEAPAGPR
ncbi:MAG TPA: hypothetical protein VHS99_22895, partial [Chloroflexota bacterium]|nr:hypothetical protein [Chloroflexota bacterium]